MDGVVYVDRPGKPKPGDWLDVRIVRADAHDLYGAPVRAPSRKRELMGTD
jgi:hypothetical protein